MNVSITVVVLVLNKNTPNLFVKCILFLFQDVKLTDFPSDTKLGKDLEIFSKKYNQEVSTKKTPCGTIYTLLKRKGK